MVSGPAEEGTVSAGGVQGKGGGTRAPGGTPKRSFGDILSDLSGPK